MPSDRWTAPAGNPDAVSGATRPDQRRENGSRAKDDAPGAAPTNDVVGSPGFGGTPLISGAEKVLLRNDMGGGPRQLRNSIRTSGAGTARS